MLEGRLGKIIDTFTRHVADHDKKSIIEARRQGKVPPLEETLPGYIGRALFDIPAFTLDSDSSKTIFDRLLIKPMQYDTPTVIIFSEEEIRANFGHLDDVASKDPLARRYRDATIKFPLRNSQLESIEDVMQNMTLTTRDN